MSLRARCANAKNVDDVMSVGKAVGRGDRLSPLFYGICFNLHGLSALAANQVMVMAGGAARAIKVFTVGRGENIGPLVVNERREVSIHRGKTERVALSLEPAMQSLR
jgi:hypothetical protein